MSRAADSFEVLGAAGRWLVDERSVAHAPGGLLERTVDVTRAAAWIDARALAGAKWGPALLVVRAAALALARRADLHKTVAGYRSLQAGSVDIGLSASELLRDTPLVLASADGQSLAGLASSLQHAHEEDPEGRAELPAWWATLVPFAFLRRAVVRWLQRSFGLQRRRGGTFQVTCADAADLVVPLRFGSGSALGAGRVRDALVALDGRMEVRRVMTLTLVADHVAMDGVRAATLLNEIATVLESDQLAAEMV
jgi:2-oxoacid dehydrogenases acyltransferase (catalytic domain)